MCKTGKRIKELRKSMGYSAEELAPLVGLSAATIYRYENGDIKKVNTEKLTPFARVLCTTEAYLMGWTDDPNESAMDSVREDVDAPSEDKELWELRESLRQNPDMRILFSLAKDAKPKALKQAIAIVKALNEDE